MVLGGGWFQRRCPFDRFCFYNLSTAHKSPAVRGKGYNSVPHFATEPARSGLQQFPVYLLRSLLSYLAGSADRVGC